MNTRKPTTALAGDRFGRLSVMRDGEPQTFASGAKYRRVHCRCDCGNEAFVLAQSLTSGNTTSCGCARSEATRARTRKSDIYRSGAHASWRAMKQRCEYPDSTEFARYGARGIAICERWQSFENFYADMGDRPAGYSLERIDIDRGYSPDNCKWIPGREQAWNRRTVKLTEDRRRSIVALRNGGLTLRAIAEQFGATRHAISRFLAGKSFRDSVEK